MKLWADRLNIRVCVCVCLSVWLWVRMPVWGSHQAGSDLTLTHSSSSVPAATFSFSSEVFWRIFSPSQSRNDTVWLWSSHSGSIYKTASCSGTDSLSACSRQLTSHTHTHSQRNHQYQDTQSYTREPQRILGKAFNPFLAALLWRQGFRKWGFASGLARGQRREEQEEVFLAAVAPMEIPAVVLDSHIAHWNIPTRWPKLRSPHSSAFGRQQTFECSQFRGLSWMFVRRSSDRFWVNCETNQITSGSDPERVYIQSEKIHQWIFKDSKYVLGMQTRVQPSSLW